MVLCCSICQEQLEGKPASDWSDGGVSSLGNDDPKICAVKCGHIFHYECIRQWWLTLFRSAGVTQPPPNFQPRVRCPVCRQQNVAQLFEIHLISADDNLYPSENEIQEFIILNQNLVDIEEECKGIETRIEKLDKKLACHDEAIAKLNADVLEITIERDKYLTLVRGQKIEKSEKPETSKRAMQYHNSHELKTLKKNNDNLDEVKPIPLIRKKRILGICKSKVHETSRNRYNLRLRTNCRLV